MRNTSTNQEASKLLILTKGSFGAPESPSTESQMGKCPLADERCETHLRTRSSKAPNPYEREPWSS
ncbi:hypothetical protein TVAG_275950 [Trichomonas vaginalis G3]|uniref:Uncharacterized protein n=1 Tax=Trichomonas vaginalis (strain ATCC PRA-98 / G3) TaxID=412133 RepID=A2EYG8_TRIV3|nr:hypothetical protein TVAG_275950 [Trichomonas vaginalis G3]|eukprot:XP_001314636.1 hypothetical protein [Trichomonas vaginalis G3]